MPFSPPVPRQQKHTRDIHCEGFRRDDGLWDIEASIIDTKPFRYSEMHRGVMEPGSAVHNMAIRLTIDNDMVVRAIEVSMPAVPHPTCQNGMPNYQGLVGAKINGGWRRAVQMAVGTARGCTHVRELLFPMATVAFQTIFGGSEDIDDALKAHKSGERPYFIDGCIGWAVDGELVAEVYPEFAENK